MLDVKTIKTLFIIAITILAIFLSVYIVGIILNRENVVPVSKIKENSNINDEEDSGNVYKVTKITKMDIKSREINRLITNKWVTKNVDFGSQESIYEDYDIYFDEGLEVKTISQKVFNIVFTEKYNGNILDNINVNTPLQEIIKILGKPSFGDVDSKLIGYRGEDIYIFFTEKEASVYRVEKDTEKKEFIELLKKFEQDRDVWNLGNSLTDLWQDYDRYNYDTDYVNLTYTLRGLKLQYNYTNQNGITIFNNYSGNIMEGKDIRLLVQDESLIPEYIFLEPNIDLVYEYEKTRSYKSNSLYSPLLIEGENTVDTNMETNKFRIYTEMVEEGYKNVRLVSTTKEYPNSQLMSETIITSYLWYDDTRLIYGIRNKGIYIYDCVTRQIYEIAKGNEEYKLKTYKDKTLKYDNTQVTIQ